MMKHWRVGSLSMGLLLVATGIVMLVSLVIRVNVLDVLLTFWPLILIFLGIEILLHLFVKKSDDADGKLRYDALSILFISFLLIISIGFYAVTFYTGLFDTREDFYASLGFMNNSAFTEDTVTLTGTKELVVFNGFNHITVLSAADDKLNVEYSVSINTYDKSYAEDMLDDIVKIESGERAYLRTETAILSNNRKVGWPVVSCVIYLPSDTTLDLSQFWGSLEFDSAIEGQIIQQ